MASGSYADILTYSDERVELDPATQYLTITVKRRHGGLEQRECVFGHEIKTHKQFRLIPGAFIISRVQCWHEAYAIVSNQVPQNMIASSNYDQFVISPSVDPRFFWWLSHSPQFTETIRNSAFGVVVEKMVFNRDAWLDKELPLPERDVQCRIAAKIDELATKIDTARKLCQQMKDEAEAIVISTHLDLAGKRSRKLVELLALDEDQIKIDPSAEYPQVGVRGFGGGLFTKPATRGNETTYKVFNRLYDGALVLSQVKGWEGAVAICDNALDGWFVSPEYRTFRCIPGEARPGYLAALVRTKWFWSRLKDATRGVGARRERTRPDQFLEIEIPMPDVEQQGFGERLFAKVDALNRLQTESAIELDALMPSILDKAFRGKL